MSSVTAIVLAAGKGTRMKSEVAKVLHPVCHNPMLWYVLESAREVTDEQLVVIGYGKEQVEAFIQDRYPKSSVHTVIQDKQLGTGHAVACAKHKAKSEISLVLLGDTPLLTGEQLKGLLDFHQARGGACTVLTAETEEPYGYGRIVRDSQGQVTGIVEERDATEGQKRITEINTGIMVFDTELLFSSLEGLKPENSQGEYYLTDVISILSKSKGSVYGYRTEDIHGVLGVNDRSELSRAEQLMRSRINTELMRSGVTMIDPNHTYIDPRVEIGQDTVIYPNTFVLGETVVQNRVTLGPETRVSDAHIGWGSVIEKSQVMDSRIESQVKVGPNAQIRPGCHLHSGVKIGNFVEVKNSRLGEGTKASHLAYIGDAVIGKEVNLGAGSVIVNYDGQKKHQTIIEDEAFVGCNVNLVAPVKIGQKAFVAAGSTITEDVPDESLAIARQRQTNKEGWVTKKFDRH